MTHANTPAAHEAALTGADHQEGNAQAGLILLEYGDYECPTCIRAEPAVRRLVETFGHDLRFVFRHYPLMSVHPHAEQAAEAAEAAAAQGQFWAMHQLLFKQAQGLDLPALIGYAEAIGLNIVRFKADMADHLYTQRVQEHRRAGQRSGFHTIPAFFLDGKLVDVSSGMDQLEAAVRAALAGG